MKTFKNIIIMVLSAVCIVMGTLLIMVNSIVKEELQKQEQKDEFVEYLYDMGYEEVEYEGRQDGDHGNHMYGIVHYDGRIYQIDYDAIDDTKDKLNEAWNFIKRN